MAYLCPNSIIDIRDMPSRVRLKLTRSDNALYVALQSLIKSKTIIGEHADIFINGSMAQGTPAWFIYNGTPVLLSDIDIVVVGEISNVLRNELSEFLKVTESRIRKSLCCATSFKISIKIIDDINYQEDAGIKDALLTHGVSIDEVGLIDKKPSQSLNTYARDFDMCIPYGLYRSALFGEEKPHCYQSAVYELAKSIWRSTEIDHEIRYRVGLVYDIDRLQEYVKDNVDKEMTSFFDSVHHGACTWLSIIDNILNQKTDEKLISEGLRILQYKVMSEWPDSILLNKISHSSRYFLRHAAY